MATSVTCMTEGCPELGIEKTMLGGGDFDETIPTYCGACGTLLLGAEPELDLGTEIGDAVPFGSGPSWADVPPDVTYEK